MKALPQHSFANLNYPGHTLDGFFEIEVQMRTLKRMRAGFFPIQNRESKIDISLNRKCSVVARSRKNLHTLESNWQLSKKGVYDLHGFLT